MIDDIELARALHVLFVVHWIGGVAFVTLVALPLARSKAEAKAGWMLFEAIENRFAAQVRWSIPLAGLTGLWMTWRLGLWGLFADPSFWWLDAMAFVWTLFMLIVFVVEPLAHRRLSALAAHDPAGALRRLFRAHLVLLDGGGDHHSRRRRRRQRRVFPMTTLIDATARGSAAASRAWRGAAFLSRGFRPFFLAAGVWAIVGMALWPAVFVGAIALPTAFSAVDWHAHEMIFGYGGAVVAGFLLTAIPNWTGRLPVAGVPLAALAALWAAGRVAVFASAAIGRPAAAAIDGSFLVVFAALVAREVAAGRNWRNLKTAGLVLALALVNVAFHVEDARSGLAEVSTRAALGLLVMLILLIGGRVTPSFTGNWLAKAGAAREAGSVRQAGRNGDGAVGPFAYSLGRRARRRPRPARWRSPPARPTSGGFPAGRACRRAGTPWCSCCTRASSLRPPVSSPSARTPYGRLRRPYAAGVHVWAVGAIGVMTLAMMTRATLGHGGRRARRLEGNALRLSLRGRRARRARRHGVPARLALPLMYVAAAAWLLAFAAFLFVYAPMLIRPQRDRAEGTPPSGRRFQTSPSEFSTRLPTPSFSPTARERSGAGTARRRHCSASPPRRRSASLSISSSPNICAPRTGAASTRR